MDPFGDYELKHDNVEVDPAADFLAREQAEFAKIEDNGFGNDFDSFAPSSVQEAQLNDEPNFNAFESNSNSDFGSVPANINQDVYHSISNVDRITQEPEKIKRWREEQKTRIEAKDIEEEVRKRELREAAKRELDEWYRQRAEQLVKTKETNKQLTESEQNFNSEAANSQKVAEWDRIAKHCEFNPKANRNTKDVSRFRSLLLQLKQQPLTR